MNLTKCLRDLQCLSDTRRKAYRSINLRAKFTTFRAWITLPRHIIGDVVYFERALLNCSFFLESETSHRYINLIWTWIFLQVKSTTANFTQHFSDDRGRHNFTRSVQLTINLLQDNINVLFWFSLEIFASTTSSPRSRKTKDVRPSICWVTGENHEIFACKNIYRFVFDMTNVQVCFELSQESKNFT